MYPQTVVPSGDELHTTLTNGMDAPDSGVIATGTYYTANKDFAAWNPNNIAATQELNYVYSYKGNNYVKVTPWAGGNGDDAIYKYNTTALNPNTDPIGRHTWNGNSFRWFKVEPIKWIVLNYNWLPKGTIENYAGPYAYGGDASKAHSNLELYAADVLVGGVAPSVSGNTLWSDGDINSYLNTKFHDEAFSTSEVDLIQTSTIYNNNSDGTEFNTAAHNLNANHLQSGGMNQTDQKIYLLSHYELSNTESPYVKNKVFDEGTAGTLTRGSLGTDYARAHRLWITTAVSGVLYWTRTAMDSDNIYRIDSNGGLWCNPVTTSDQGTRPALQLKLNGYFSHLKI